MMRYLVSSSHTHRNGAGAGSDGEDHNGTSYRHTTTSDHRGKDSSTAAHHVDRHPGKVAVEDDKDDDDDQGKSRRHKQRLLQRKQHRRRGGKNGNTRRLVRIGLVTACVLLVIIMYRAAMHMRTRKMQHALQRRERAERLWREHLHQRQNAPKVGDANKVGTSQESQEGEAAGANRIVVQKAPSLSEPLDVGHQLAHLPMDPYERNRKLEQTFLSHRGTSQVEAVLPVWLNQLNHDILNNVNGGIRWIRPYLLPPLPGQKQKFDNQEEGQYPAKKGRKFRPSFDRPKEYFQIRRNKQHMKWREEWDAMTITEQQRGPIVDYTNPNKYTYPEIVAKPPPSHLYPVLKPLGQLMSEWNQDEDYNGTIHETLMHFNYSDPMEVEMAKRYREAKLPFKFYNVPEVLKAGQLWTDEYVDANFHGKSSGPKPRGTPEESPNNYFAFHYPEQWNVDTMGLPPTRNLDWSFAQWAAHAKFADATRLSPHQPHFYWQTGVPATERHQPSDQWTFISRDLPSFSSPTETLFVWHPDQQKGIQCRFGERGVVAATHYDGGRNSVAMITGAKRYILSPPRACSKLGIFTSSSSAIFRHSLLNFAHIPLTNETHNDMSIEEREWLRLASTAEAVETVVKAGEVLYIPSHWFHYIVSLQKSAQCNVRSGIDIDGHDVFGGRNTVQECKDWTATQ